MKGVDSFRRSEDGGIEGPNLSSTEQSFGINAKVRALPPLSPLGGGFIPLLEKGGELKSKNGARPRQF